MGPIPVYKDHDKTQSVDYGASQQFGNLRQESTHDCGTNLGRTFLCSEGRADGKPKWTERHPTANPGGRNR
jgi:hypothetical protein